MDERSCGETLMSTFDEDLFQKGLEQRKATLGADYVEKNLAAADEFTRPISRFLSFHKHRHTYA